MEGAAGKRSVETSFLSGDSRQQFESKLEKPSELSLSDFDKAFLGLFILGTGGIALIPLGLGLMIYAIQKLCETQPLANPGEFYDKLHREVEKQLGEKNLDTVRDVSVRFYFEGKNYVYDMRLADDKGVQYIESRFNGQEYVRSSGPLNFQKLLDTIQTHYNPPAEVLRELYEKIGGEKPDFNESLNSLLNQFKTNWNDGSSHAMLEIGSKKYEFSINEEEKNHKGKTIVHCGCTEICVWLRSGAPLNVEKLLNVLQPELKANPQPEPQDESQPETPNGFWQKFSSPTQSFLDQLYQDEI